MDAFKNFAQSTLSAGINNSVTSLTVLAGTGARYADAPFQGVIWNQTDYPNPASDPDVEVVRVTAIVTDTFTIIRAQEGTSATNHNTAGKTYGFTAPLTAKTLNDDIPAVSLASFDLIVTSGDQVVVDDITGNVVLAI